MQATIVTNSEAETEAWGQAFAKTLKRGSGVALYGNLGAGKTLLSRAICRALGFQGAVSSPTYTIVHEYPNDPPIYHVDLYRLSSGSDLEEAGLSRCLSQGAVTLIEWPERLQSLLGITHKVTLEILSETARRITVEEHDPETP